MSDEGIYRIYMYNNLRPIRLDILAAFEGMSSEIGTFCVKLNPTVNSRVGAYLPITIYIQHSSKHQ